MRTLGIVLLLLLLVGGGLLLYASRDSLRDKPVLGKLVSFFPGRAPAPTPSATPLPTPEPTPTPLIKISELPITLPMLDALFFVDRDFGSALQNSLALTAEQVEQLRQAARAETQSLREPASESEATGATRAAGARAAEKISAILGAEKATRFADLALERWRLLGTQEEAGSVGDEVALASVTPDSRLTAPAETAASPVALPAAAATAPLAAGSPGAPLGKTGTPTAVNLPAPNAPSPLAATANPGAKAAASPLSAATATRTAKPGAAGFFVAPSDTRIVVNAPAYRMDVFENGQLVKSYKAAMGYPEFPTPTGVRKATQIIFNPTWTPPDEPWVESSSTVKVGQTIAAGDKLNPLGIIKIPIGAPSLIHGGKSLPKIGTVGSHGCVGLTNEQVADFAKLLGRISGSPVSDDDLAKHAADRKKTHVLKLKQNIPVELRYETILVEDGKLYIYRDVYDRDTNRRENLATVLQNFGVTLDDLTPAERAQVDAAISAFFATEAADEKNTEAKPSSEKDARKRQLALAQQSKKYKAAKVAVIEIAALAGKGYPAAVNLDAGTPIKAQAAAVGRKKN